MPCILNLRNKPEWEWLKSHTCVKSVKFQPNSFSFAWFDEENCQSTNNRYERFCSRVDTEKKRKNVSLWDICIIICAISYDNFQRSPLTTMQCYASQKNMWNCNRIMTTNTYDIHNSLELIGTLNGAKGISKTPVNTSTMMFTSNVQMWW